MTGFRIRLLASALTALGLIAGGFDAHVAPQTNGLWHGITGQPSIALGLIALCAAAVVWSLGEVASVRPFCWMGAGLLPLLPATTGFGSALLVFSGYTTALLFAVLLAFCARGLMPRLKGLTPASAFLISFGFFIFVGRFLPGPAGPQGDEPHYLLIAQSLLHDGDVDLKNQFEERAYSSFTSAPLEPHTAPRSPKGKLYAIHTPGLPALIAPGFAVLGFAGARATVSAVMAAVVSLLFGATRAMFGPSSATFLFLVATFASPLPIYANALYPDSVAPLAVAAALSFLVAPSGPLLGLAAAWIAALPWFHPRFVPLALLLAFSISLRDGLRGRRAAFALLPLLVSIGLLLLHFQSLFGSASLSAAYGPGFSSDVSLARAPLGAMALLLDRQFGLLLFSPLLLAGMPGIVDLWRRDRLLAFVVAAVFSGVLVIGASFSMWWGGASAPARLLIGATPALLLACAACWSAAEVPPDRRTLLALTSGFGLGVLFLACLAPRALHNRPDGESGLLRLLIPVLDADRFFPGFTFGETRPWVAAVWGAIVVAAVLRPRAAPLLTALCLALVAAVPVRPLLDPFASTLRVLESWTDHRRGFGGEENEMSFRLSVPLGRAPWELRPGVSMFSPRFSLPRGAWKMTISSRTKPAPDVLNVAQVALVNENGELVPLAAAVLRVGEPMTLQTFLLAKSERFLRLRGDGLQAETEVVSVTLTPTPR